MIQVSIFFPLCFVINRSVSRVSLSSWRNTYSNSDLMHPKQLIQVLMQVASVAWQALVGLSVLHQLVYSLIHHLLKVAWDLQLLPIMLSCCKFQWNVVLQLWNLEVFNWKNDWSLLLCNVLFSIRFASQLCQIWEHTYSANHISPCKELAT